MWRLDKVEIRLRAVLYKPRSSLEGSLGSIPGPHPTEFLIR